MLGIVSFFLVLYLDKILMLSIELLPNRLKGSNSYFRVQIGYGDGIHISDLVYMP